jgi:hypothetical protein
VQAWRADAALLADFLNDMDALQADRGVAVHGPGSDPAEWGDLVIARSETGDILFVDPELYWDGIATVFRSHGDDPHPWRGRS